jgi:protein-S-isoprenylcysteine O-methyltransferase Ste14
LIGAIVIACIVAPASMTRVLQVCGVVLALAGAALGAWAARTLGASLTPFPQPRADARLVTRGPFALVRHPIYLGGALFLVGCSLVRSWVALALSAMLLVLWALKARVEERHLLERFPEYRDYCRSVRFRLLPFLY